MESNFKVGEIVVRREGSVRMKVAKIDKEAKRVRCTWTRGKAKHSQSFEPGDLVAAPGARAPA